MSSVGLIGLLPTVLDDGSVVVMKYRIRKPRGLRVREVALAWGSESSPAEAPRTVFPVMMAARGRVVVPAEVRERLHINEGDRLALIVDPDGSIRLQTRKVAIANLRGAFKHLAPGRLLSEELIAERRVEAAQEERESLAFARALQRRRKKSV
jgi:AbrB family looped-hinge helix DNA binding protein